MGAMGADHGPPAAGVAPVRELGAEAMPPLWQYLSPLGKNLQADEPIAAPKGRGSLSLAAIACKSSTSGGTVGDSSDRDCPRRA
jgi:hypothetical protein